MELDTVSTPMQTAAPKPPSSLRCLLGATTLSVAVWVTLSPAGRHADSLTALGTAQLWG